MAAMPVQLQNTRLQIVPEYYLKCVYIRITTLAKLQLQLPYVCMYVMYVYSMYVCIYVCMYCMTSQSAAEDGITAEVEPPLPAEALAEVRSRDTPMYFHIATRPACVPENGIHTFTLTSSRHTYIHTCIHTYGEVAIESGEGDASDLVLLVHNIPESAYPRR